MSDYSRILDMIDDIHQQLDAVKDELGVLSTQLEMAGTDTEAQLAVRVNEVVPPSVASVEIVGGEQTEQFPDCCAVGDPYRYCCSGTLITQNIVITADHCHGITRVFVRGNDVSKPEDGETFGVMKQFSHPEVDLRVLVLDGQSHVTPRQIARGTEGIMKSLATIVGFGTIDIHGTVGYGLKRRVDVPIISLDCNDPSHPKKYGCLPGKEIIAGHAGLLKDTCRGDSGGPLYIQSAEGAHYLLGVTSRGTRNGFTTCGDGGVYVRVDLCLNWIREITGVDIEGPYTIA